MLVTNIILNVVLLQNFQGFAFINFHRKEDAERAIAGVSGFGYDHLILNVEWAK
jgi:RNA recognition motif-containing protein